MRLALAISLLLASPAIALDLSDCDRTTHISHGGETGHRDFGDARVGWANWWSQEGVFTDLVIANCQTGEHLTARVREERMNERPPFDRTEKAVRIVETEMAAASALFSFERLAEALRHSGRDIQIAALEAEPCACAALYPEHQGDRLPFEVPE